jgi:hypothetical protein
VERPAIAANVDRRAIDECTQGREVNVSAIDDAGSSEASLLFREGRDVVLKGLFRGTGGERDAQMGVVTQQVGGKVRKTFGRPAPKRTARTDVNERKWRVVPNAGSRQALGYGGDSVWFRGHFDRWVAATREFDSERAQEIPLIRDRVARRDE